MGLFDKLRDSMKKVGKNPEQEKENEAMKIINQVREITGVDRVFEMLDLIDHTTGSLVSGANIIERKEEAKEGEQIFTVIHPDTNEINRRLRITLSGEQIDIRGGTENRATKEISSLKKIFDRKSKVETYSIRLKGNKETRQYTSIEATRDLNDIEKIECKVTDGNQTFTRSVDASLASADISTLDAVEEVNFASIDPNMGFDSNWSTVRRKIEKSANYEGLCNFIHNNNQKGESFKTADYVLDVESGRRNRNYITNRLAEELGENPNTIIGAMGLNNGMRYDMFGNRITRTELEKREDRKTFGTKGKNDDLGIEFE